MKMQSIPALIEILFWNLTNKTLSTSPTLRRAANRVYVASSQGQNARFYLGVIGFCAFLGLFAGLTLGFLNEVLW